MRQSCKFTVSLQTVQTGQEEKADNKKKCEVVDDATLLGSSLAFSPVWWITRIASGPSKGKAPVVNGAI